jgi:hypothetical protein
MQACVTPRKLDSRMLHAASGCQQICDRPAWGAAAFSKCSHTTVARFGLNQYQHHDSMSLFVGAAGGGSRAWRPGRRSRRGPCIGAGAHVGGLRRRPVQVPFSKQGPLDGLHCLLLIQVFTLYGAGWGRRCRVMSACHAVMRVCGNASQPRSLHKVAATEHAGHANVLGCRAARFAGEHRRGRQAAWHRHSISGPA